MIHADIDPAEIGKNRHADVPIVGDIKAVIRDLLAAFKRGPSGPDHIGNEGVGDPGPRPVVVVPRRAACHLSAELRPAARWEPQPGIRHRTIG